MTTESVTEEEIEALRGLIEEGDVPMEESEYGEDLGGE